MAWLSKLFGDKSGSGGKEPGRDVGELAGRLKSTPEALHAVKISYRELSIAKRDGTKRMLLAPDEPLKIAQRQILHRLLGRLSAHPSAMGFEKGQSIATNAAAHVGAAVILKMDLRDFFTRTTAARVRSYFVKIGWSGEAADLLVHLTTHKGGLPQGAPTSPRLSNLVNYLLDSRLFALAVELEAKYTRYADDMTFSFMEDNREKIAQAIQATQKIVDEFGYHLHTAKKLRVARQYERMLVTGLVVNVQLHLPRSTRRRLRAVEHHLKTGKPATMNQMQLRGWRALEAMVAAKQVRSP